MEDTSSQIERLLQILEANKSLQTVLDRAQELHLPNWYVGAGGIVQTVWNVYHNFDPEHGIKDYDLVYYDDSNITYEAEDAFIQTGNKLFKDISVLVEIKNQARVHVWYKEHFGHDIDQYESVEHAISTWPTTATSIGIRKENGQYKVFAPFGVEDILNMTVRANKRLITERIYLDKVNRWKNIWPFLQVVPWS